jgi:mRNA interferase MazF
MGTFAAGQIVVVRFPFSDLSSTKWRPALVLADAGRDDWILCQITSNPYGDPRALELDPADFADGSLHQSSFVRPAKLFTAHASLIAQVVGSLKSNALTRIHDAVTQVLKLG